MNIVTQVTQTALVDPATQYVPSQNTTDVEKTVFGTSRTFKRQRRIIRTRFLTIPLTRWRTTETVQAHIYDPNTEAHETSN